MIIKQLIKNEQEYWEFVWPFIDWTTYSCQSLWREEDLPKLQPFFDAQKWDDEIQESFEFYKKCCEEYGNKNVELRDSVSRFNPEDILEAFGYEIPDEDYDYTKDKPINLIESSIEVFPFMVVGDIDCSCDYRIILIHRVSLKDFKLSCTN